MSFRWAYLDAAGRPVGASDAFPDRKAAEQWLGETWSDLLDDGIEEVTLEETGGDAPLYRMALRPGSP